MNKSWSEISKEYAQINVYCFFVFKKKSFETLFSNNKEVFKECLVNLNANITIDNIGDIIDKIEVSSWKANLKFVSTINGNINEIFISSDLFYIEIHVNLSEQEILTVKIAQNNNEPLSKFYLALSSLENDLNELNKLQNSITDPYLLVMRSPLGYLVPRSCGIPMKLSFFVLPIDLVDIVNHNMGTLDLKRIFKHSNKFSVFVYMIGTELTHKIQTMPLLTLIKSPEGKILPHFAGLNLQNSSQLNMTFVLDFKNHLLHSSDDNDENKHTGRVATSTPQTNFYISNVLIAKIQSITNLSVNYIYENKSLTRCLIDEYLQVQQHLENLENLQQFSKVNNHTSVERFIVDLPGFESTENSRDQASESSTTSTSLHLCFEIDVNIDNVAAVANTNNVPPMDNTTNKSAAILPLSSTRGSSLRGVKALNVPFTHPTHIPQCLNVFRHQAMLNSLIESCLRRYQPPPSTSSNGKETCFPVAALANQIPTKSFDTVTLSSSENMKTTMEIDDEIKHSPTDDNNDNRHTTTFHLHVLSENYLNLDFYHDPTASIINIEIDLNDILAMKIKIDTEMGNSYGVAAKGGAGGISSDQRLKELAQKMEIVLQKTFSIPITMRLLIKYIDEIMQRLRTTNIEASETAVDKVEIPKNDPENYVFNLKTEARALVKHDKSLTNDIQNTQHVADEQTIMEEEELPKLKYFDIKTTTTNLTIANADDNNNNNNNITKSYYCNSANQKMDNLTDIVMIDVIDLGDDTSPSTKKEHPSPPATDALFQVPPPLKKISIKELMMTQNKPSPPPSAASCNTSQLLPLPSPPPPLPSGSKKSYQNQITPSLFSKKAATNNAATAATTKNSMAPATSIPTSISATTKALPTTSAITVKSSIYNNNNNPTTISNAPALAPITSPALNRSSSSIPSRSSSNEGRYKKSYHPHHQTSGETSSLISNAKMTSPKSSRVNDTTQTLKTNNSRDITSGVSKFSVFNTTKGNLVTSCSSTTGNNNTITTISDNKTQQKQQQQPPSFFFNPPIPPPPPKTITTATGSTNNNYTGNNLKARKNSLSAVIDKLKSSVPSAIPPPSHTLSSSTGTSSSLQQPHDKYKSISSSVINIRSSASNSPNTNPHPPYNTNNSAVISTTSSYYSSLSNSNTSMPGIKMTISKRASSDGSLKIVSSVLPTTTTASSLSLSSYNNNTLAKKTVDQSGSSIVEKDKHLATEELSDDIIIDHQFYVPDTASTLFKSSTNKVAEDLTLVESTKRTSSCLEELLYKDIDERIIITTTTPTSDHLKTKMDTTECLTYHPAKPNQPMDIDYRAEFASQFTSIYSTSGKVSKETASVVDPLSQAKRAEKHAQEEDSLMDEALMD